MASEDDPKPKIRLLTPAEEARAMALFRDLLTLREAGIKWVLLQNEDEIGLRAVGQRRALSGLKFL